MIDRLKILAKIDDIENKHCSVCTIDMSDSNKYCYTHCNYGFELRELGDELLSSDAERIEQTLAKGKDMTTNEIRFLLSKEVTRKEIAKAIGIKTQSQVKPFFDGIQPVYTISPKKEMKQRKPMKKVARQIIESNYHLEKRVLIKKIITELGVVPSTAYNYVNEYEKFKSQVNRREVKQNA